MRKPCLITNCTNYTDSTRCTQHEREYQSRRNRQENRKAYRDPNYKAITISGPCIECGSYEDLTKDHLIPLSKGGTNNPSNIVCRCRKCNSRKGNS